MRRTDAGIIYSPSDLVRFLKSPFASWMERRYLEDPGSVTPDEEDPQLMMLARKGDEHERECLEAFAEEGLEVKAIERDAPLDVTREALASRVSVIHQARLSDGVFEGFADFLIWRDEQLEPGYEILDAKLARHVRPYFLVQLSCYADLLQSIQGIRPISIGVILGNNQIARFRTSDFHYYYRWLRGQFLALMGSFPGGNAPEPQPFADHGRWASHAQRWFEERDHLLQVANITTGQIAKLRKADIGSLSALASAGASRVPGMSAETYARLRHQARLQVESRRRECPVYETLEPPSDNPALGLSALPPSSPGDVYFDMEGYPLEENGLEYLFGAVVLDDGEPAFNDWWAADADSERKAFESFVDWAYSRWQAHPGMHIYHYGHYETTALRRLMGQYGTREDELDAILRGQTFVDLHSIVRHGVRVGEPGYSLKNLERIFSSSRAGDVATAADSVVYFDQWLESGEPFDWRRSSLLKSIREYNREDCLSTWKLAVWLRRLQEESGLNWRSPAQVVDSSEEQTTFEPPPDRARRSELARKILAEVDSQTNSQTEPLTTAADQQTARLLAGLLEFHQREQKPAWWRLFDRLEKTEEELAEDIDCLAGITLRAAVSSSGKNAVFLYRFDPDQDTKLTAGDKVKFVPEPDLVCEITELDANQGVLRLSVSKKKLENAGMDSLPTRTSLIPFEYVPTGILEQAIENVVSRWHQTGELPGALEQILLREQPTDVSGKPVSLQSSGNDLVERAQIATTKLYNSSLCIQGPPGAGKTYTGARVILELAKERKRIGITSNSHKAILNLMKAVCEAGPIRMPMVKVGGTADDPVLDALPRIELAQPRNAVRIEGPVILGGTAWFFARNDFCERLDYLFVDEAGQVSLANLAAMSLCAENIVLMGDQMQLGQPIQGSHPGDAGTSILEYYLGEHQTIPPNFGLFLDKTWRMHPDICQFVSDAIYESRLTGAEHTANRRILVPDRLCRINQEAGLFFVPVDHEGNVQSSQEEVDAIEKIVDDLVGRTLVNEMSEPARQLQLSDFLFVAPFNMQVRKLQRHLGKEAKVGSVDKFQGQEAPVVIVSLCSSLGEGSRGIDFILDRNRFNVAVSRAQIMAIVVGSTKLGSAPTTSIEGMRRLNLFHHFVGTAFRQEP